MSPNQGDEGPTLMASMMGIIQPPGFKSRLPRMQGSSNRIPGGPLLVITYLVVCVGHQKGWGGCSQRRPVFKSSLPGFTSGHPPQPIPQPNLQHPQHLNRTLGTASLDIWNSFMCSVHVLNAGTPWLQFQNLSIPLLGVCSPMTRMIA